jgi:hypothetical protein
MKPYRESLGSSSGRPCGARPGGLRPARARRHPGRRGPGPQTNTSGGRFAPAVSWRPAGFAAGIVPADSDRRMPRVRGPSWLAFGVKGLFPPKPPFISSLFRGGVRPTKGTAGHPWPPAAPLVGGSGCVPTARPVGILPRRVPPLPARRPPARASVAVRPGSHPGKPAHTASLFHSFIIAYYYLRDSTLSFSLENCGFAGFSACAVMVYFGTMAVSPGGSFRPEMQWPRGCG